MVRGGVPGPLKGEAADEVICNEWVCIATGK